MATLAGFDSVTPPFYPYGRVALALSHAAIDARTHLNVSSLAAFASANNAVTDYVQLIVNSSKQWQSLKDHPYPKSLADGTAELNGFRHYLVQDSIYLEYYYRVRMQSVGKTGTFKEMSDFAGKIFNSLAYVTNMRDDCTTKLGVLPNVVDKEEQSVAIKNSLALYKTTVETGDWLDLHIVLLPCILVSDSAARSEMVPDIFKGYYTIADKLLRSPDTVRNTVYYTLWVVFNSYESSVIKYKKFINDAITPALWKEREKRWTESFDRACNNEKAIFELGQQGYKSYDVVASDGKSLVQDGTYTIRNYRTNGYLTLTANNTVTLTDVATDGKWEFKNVADGKGFTITKKSLFLSVNINQGPPFKAFVGDAQKYWAVNSINALGAEAQEKAYQLLVPGELQSVLGARQVAVTDNAQSSDQIWVIEPSA